MVLLRCRKEDFFRIGVRSILLCSLRFDFLCPVLLDTKTFVVPVLTVSFGLLVKIRFPLFVRTVDHIIY